MEQTIRFCRTGDDVRIAVATAGRGPGLLKSAHWLTHLDHDWHSPVWRHQHQELARHFTFVRYDQRGSGLSDRVPQSLSLDTWVDDLLCVADSAGLERFILLGMSQGGPIAIEFADRHPQRVSHLILYGSYSRGRRHWDGEGDDARASVAMVELIRHGWSHENPAFRQLFSSLFMPDATPDQIQSFNDLQRQSTSPEMAARIVSIMDDLDVTATARRLKVPTLVMHCEGDARVPFAEGRRLAAQIPGARFAPLPGRNHIIQARDAAWPMFTETILSFVGMKGSAVEHPDIGHGLTHRERQVLDLLAQGLGNGAIATRLGLSPKTVRNHLSHIVHKLGVQGRGQAIVRAREAGFGRSFGDS